FFCVGIAIEQSIRNKHDVPQRPQEFADIAFHMIKVALAKDCGTGDQKQVFRRMYGVQHEYYYISYLCYIYNYNSVIENLTQHSWQSRSASFGRLNWSS